MKNFVVGILVVLLLSCSGKEDDKERIWKEVSGLLSKEILARAEADLEKLPVTVTSFIAERSVGGLHDFYSEGDYLVAGHAAPRSSVHPAGRRNESR